MNQQWPAIHNARDTLISQGGASAVPSVETVLYGVLESLTFEVITQTQDPATFEVTLLRRPVNTLGSVQPLKTRELEIKAEGERSWTWLKIYALPNVTLKPKDEVVLTGEFAGTYRVMGEKKWAGKGHMYYELVPTYQLPEAYGE